MDIIEELQSLSDAEFQSCKKWVDDFKYPESSVVLIEACRVLDYWHVTNALSQNLDQKLPVPEMDIISRGWNPALGLLLPSSGIGEGFPLVGSNEKTLKLAMSFLNQLGRHIVLKQAVEMTKNGMLTCEKLDGVIIAKMSERAQSDHYVDRLEYDKLEKTLGGGANLGVFEAYASFNRIENVESRLKNLVFPYETNRGVLVGYTSEPDIDEHYIAAVLPQVQKWRLEAGIHPDVKIGGISASNISLIVLLLVATRLKHIQMVFAGKSRYPHVNTFMSFSVWKPKAEVVSTLSTYSGLDPIVVSIIIDQLTATKRNHQQFFEEDAPHFPFFVKISDGYLLEPVSSIFRNPFFAVQFLHTSKTGKNENSIRGQRENWMISDLNALFEGNRYISLDGPARLKRFGRTVTDIDAAIFDRTTGELAIFQLKWQDFFSNSVRKQKSRAKNFVEQVDKWTLAVVDWIDEFGVESLCQSLRIKLPKGVPISTVKLFAIGRSNARFCSYGFSQNQTTTAVGTWSQFVRLRFDLGPAQQVISALYDAIRVEQNSSLEPTPIPHEIVSGPTKVIFKDLWNGFEEEN